MNWDELFRNFKLMTLVVLLEGEFALILLKLGLCVLMHMGLLYSWSNYG
jgi:hypothetical protein